MKKALENANVPIDFYGRLVDQDDAPLSGVLLTYRIQKPRMMWDSNSAVGKITTDLQGGFFITGEKGSSLSFEKFEKTGYRKTKGQDLSYVYSESASRFVPEKDHPIIFTMVNELKVERLVKESAALMLKWDGIPVFYDLKTGKIGGTGEIKITANRGQVVGEGRDVRFDWLFKVEVPNGGVIETTRAETYLAPIRGYQSAWEFGYLSSDPDWAGARKGETYLFFKLENEDCGYLQLHFEAYPGNKMSGRISSYVNPSGGQVLAE